MKQFLIYSVVIALTFSSCSIYKKYERPTDIKTDNLYGQALAETDGGTMAQLNWRELYADQHLQNLIERVMATNSDVKTQEWAIKQAEASHKASKLAFLPSLSLNPNGGYNYASEGVRGWSYSIPVALDWELDIFGGLLNQKRMAKATVEFEQDVHQAVSARLMATVASNYYQLIALDEQKKVVENAIQVWKDLVRSAEELMKNGETNALAVVQFRGQSYDFEAELTTIEHDIKALEVATCALMGEAPHAIERSSLINCPSSSVLQTGLSAQLLANRPDVRQAERNLELYYYNVNYARSNFFPKFKITAEGAYTGQWIASFLGGLTQPIFARGKVIAEHKIAKAKYEQAKIAFQQKLIDASNDVVLAMSQCETGHNNFLVRAKQVEDYQKAVEYSRTLMFNGEATYLDVLTAESNLIAKERTLINDRLEEMLGVVKLYLSLGGGY